MGAVCSESVLDFPEKKYGVIYADPPWSYRVWSKKGAGRTASAHYSVMETEAICALPIPSICTKDCTLFLWATYPNIKDAFRTVEAWGFTFKTVAFTWVKTTKHGKEHVGMGHWTRANPEIVLLGVRGKPTRQNKAVRNLVTATIQEHSRKPDEVRDRIVTLLGDLPRIELFARQRREGWDAWGNGLNAKT